jgi:hypothetical protein
MKRIIAPVVKRLKAIIIKALPREDGSNLFFEIYRIETKDRTSVPDDVMVFTNRMHEAEYYQHNENVMAC